MKVIKTASGKTRIKMSRKEWEEMGKKAGWIKEANDSLENYEKVNCCNKDLYCINDVNNCPSCGKSFNMWGQPLNPQSQWEDNDNEF